MSVGYLRLAALLDQAYLIGANRAHPFALTRCSEYIRQHLGVPYLPPPTLADFCPAKSQWRPCQTRYPKSHYKQIIKNHGTQEQGHSWCTSHSRISYGVEIIILSSSALNMTLFALTTQTAALVCSFGKGVNLRYGLTILSWGYFSFASSVLTLGCTITSSPGTQLIGVVILFLSPVCNESTTRRTSAVFRPVEAG